MKILDIIKSKLQNRINRINRSKLQNYSPSLVCSNCTGGFIYHWLGLRFHSPFINLYLTPSDFITALENWDVFINSDIKEINIGSKYLVGQIAIGGIKRA